MSAPRCISLTFLPLGLALLNAGTMSAAHAAPVDPDYETITPALHTERVPAASVDPPGLAASPLAVPDHPIGPHPRMRFVMRDGTILIGNVLAYDGQMYALWLPHSTVLARKDFFVSVTPLPVRTPEGHPKPVRNLTARVIHGL